MKIIECIFRKRIKPDIPPMPSWEEIIEKMYDRQLDSYADEVVKVIYSKDRSMRYVVLKVKRDLLIYQLEAIYKFDREEWENFRLYDNALPAMWEPLEGNTSISFFESMDELLVGMKEEPEYKQRFA